MRTPQTPVYLFKRMLDRRPFRSAVCSMGGVGSTALARHLLSFADKSVLEHAWSPALYNRRGPVRLAYIFGNPYNAVLSVFRRGYQDMHSVAMNAHSPTPARRLKDVSIEAYLDRGVDEFRIERQFDNWTDPANVVHPTILVRYEYLAENIQPVLDFFACPKPFAVRTRSSHWTDQPPHIRRGLERMYGGLLAKIEAMPPLVVFHAAAPADELRRDPAIALPRG